MSDPAAPTIPAPTIAVLAAPAPHPPSLDPPMLDPEAIAARVRSARRERDRGKVSKPFRDLVEADRHLSRAAHRLAKATARGFATYRDEQKASGAKKRDGAVRDQPVNVAKGAAAALAVASQVPVDVVRAVRTRTGVRLLRRAARLALEPLR
jgi:hypothetical protein